MTFKVCIDKGEWDQIRDWVLKHKDIETGGDLFGLWLDGQTAVVQFVLGPGKNSERTTTSFFQDVDYLHEAGTYLTKHHGLCNVGQWHSHHRINLSKPSVGDENTVWNNMPNLGLDRYIVFIANITPAVTINCFLFQIKNGQRLSVQHGKFETLQGNSPLRLNEKVLQNVYGGAESFNEITNYEKEICHISNDGVKENRNIVKAEEQSKSNKKLQESVYHSPIPRGRLLVPVVETHVVSHRNQQEKQTNNYSSNQTAGEGTYIKQPTRHGSCKQQLVKVTSYEITNEKNTVKPENDHKRGQLSSLQNRPDQGNTNFNGGGQTSTTQTRNETGNEFQSDINQTILNASKVANSGNLNYELKRKKKPTKMESAYPIKNTVQNLAEPRTKDPYNQQNISNQLDRVDIGSQGQQRNANQVILATEVKSQTITEPGDRRKSLYDNVQNLEQPSTPMDTDDVQPVTDTETRPDTPSGTMFSNNRVDKDDDLGRFCQLFARMSLCGSGRT